ncbi:tRNA (guanosine(46)-N7)-methyltransferase TrmB [Ferroacidibacillus organovorans]|uniref:tRNA (guanine-N(7)-)-methyltransferase n=1 Tax=Ferroacidibacillus organovorans TaxID=1765683 RepID=A0A1V4ESL2_9BACL|nr:tRNA (guanosine(46)-N7)-methyltransferase TrmB [Ferroacidibacillus organovorans]
MAVRIRGKEKVPGLLQEASAYLLDANHPALYQWPALGQATHAVKNLEIGSGRGTFLATMAQRNSDQLFLGVDLYIPIVARAATLLREFACPNAKLVCIHAERLPEFLAQIKFDRLYLNFSDPWPRRRNDRKRLTHPRFLERYRSFLKQDGHLEFKTDNLSLFDYSVQTLVASGWTLLEETRDLSVAKDEFELCEGRYVQTEYEQKFRALGQPICHLVAQPPMRDELSGVRSHTPRHSGI